MEQTADYKQIYSKDVIWLYLFPSIQYQSNLKYSIFKYLCVKVWWSMYKIMLLYQMWHVWRREFWLIFMFSTLYSTSLFWLSLKAHFILFLIRVFLISKVGNKILVVTYSLPYIVNNKFLYLIRIEEKGGKNVNFEKNSEKLFVVLFFVLGSIPLKC